MNICLRFCLLFLSLHIIASDRPNIILIMADDLGYGELGCTGNKVFKTPVIDNLAKQGLLLTDYHSNGAVCSPTRAALMTGRYPSRAGIEKVITAKSHRNFGMSPNEITMAEMLKKTGYKTAIFGKWHLGYEKKYNPINQGFDHFSGFISGNIDLFSHIDQEGYEDWWIQDELKNEPGYATKLITDNAIKFIESNKESPFFLYLPHPAPHYPYQGPNDLPFRKIGKGTPIDGIVQDKERAYREMIEFMDSEIGRVIKCLEDLKLRQNTLLVFTSDNGGTGKYGSTNSPYSGRKGEFLEGGHRVPCIINWLGKIAPEQTSDETVMGIDFLPTFMAITKGEIPQNHSFDGVNLSPLLFEKSLLPKRAVYWKQGDNFAMRESDWKLIGNKNGKLSLYNLKEDLKEKIDLSASHKSQLENMYKNFLIWEKDVLGK